MSDGGERNAPDLDRVNQQLDEIRRRKRGRVRWTVGRHTAEVTIRAIEDRSSAERRPPGKVRRRKRHKRLL